MLFFAVMNCLLYYMAWFLCRRGKETPQCMMRCIEPKLLAFPLYSAGGEDGLQSLLGTENLSAQNIVYLATKRREIKTWYEFIPGGWFVLRFSHIYGLYMGARSASMGHAIGLRMF